MLHQTKAGKVEVHEFDASELILDNLVTCTMYIILSLACSTPSEGWLSGKAYSHEVR